MPNNILIYIHNIYQNNNLLANHIDSGNCKKKI